MIPEVVTPRYEQQAQHHLEQPKRRLIIDALDGHLDIFSSHDTPLLKDAKPQVITNEEIPLSPQNFTYTATKTGFVLEEKGNAEHPGITLHSEYIGNDGLLLWTEVTNTTDCPLTIERINVLSIPRGIAHSPKENLSFRQMGWQSWSLSTPTIPTEYLPQEPYNDYTKKGPQLSATDFPWMTVIKNNRGEQLLMGFVTANNHASMIHAKEDEKGFHLDASTHMENTILQPHKSVSSEKLLILSAKDEQAALTTYAETVKQHMHALSSQQTPTGWSSWYEHYGNISENLIEKNLDLIVSNNLPLTTIHIDDGYQKASGDWDENLQRFPNGLKKVVETIHSKGKKAGIWWAPFLVDEKSHLFQQHPDWLLQNPESNTPQSVRKFPQGQTGKESYVYALDLTHPEVKKRLKEQTRRYVKEYGFDFLKLDFLYTGMMDGKRHETSVSTVEAYREALQIIKDEAEHTYILACGAPFLPTVGLAHGMRINADTEFIWKDKPNLWKKNPGLHNVIRSILSQNWMHNILWQNDGDALTFRDHKTNLTPAERQSLNVLLLLTGGPLFVGDDLCLLEQEKMQLLKQLLPMQMPGTAEVFGPLVEDMPTYVKRSLETIPLRRNEHGKSKTFLAGIFNWSDKPSSSHFKLSDWTEEKGTFSFYDVLENQFLGTTADVLKLPEIPPHGVRLLSLKPV